MAEGKTRQSGCPITFSLDILGDKWTLVVMRDLMFFKKRRFKEFMESREGYASNILASRLRLLELEGIVTKTPDPDSKQSYLYTLTDKGIDLLPTLVELSVWGARNDPKTPLTEEFITRMEQARDEYMEEVRKGIPRLTSKRS